MPETIKVPGAIQLLLVAADVNDQVGVFVVLAAYSAFVLSGRNLNSEMACGANPAALSRHGNDGLRPRGLAVGQCRHGGGAERALHPRDDGRAVDLPIRWPDQLTFIARSQMGGMNQRHSCTVCRGGHRRANESA